MKFWRKPLDADSFQPPHGEVHILIERCKGCRFCVEFCPKHVLEESEIFNSKGYHPPEVIHPDDCVGCRLCELICPEFAIYVKVQNDEAAASAETCEAKDQASTSIQDSAAGNDTAHNADHEPKEEVQA